MDPIRSAIADFAGYEGEMQRRLADEQIRSYAGERLSQRENDVEALDNQWQQLYGRVLQRCEFMNITVFRKFEEDPTESRIAALLSCDAEIIEAATRFALSAAEELGTLLERIEAAFAQREAAMQETL